jgi:hypothetical protein
MTKLLSSPPALRIDELIPEHVTDFSQRRLTGFDHFASDDVGVGDRNAALAEQFARR